MRNIQRIAFLVLASAAVLGSLAMSTGCRLTPADRQEIRQETRVEERTEDRMERRRDRD